MSNKDNKKKIGPSLWLTRSECEAECSNVGECVAFTSWQTGECDLYRKILAEEKWVDTHIAFSVINNRAANYNLVNCPSATTTTSTALAAGRLGM